MDIEKIKERAFARAKEWREALLLLRERGGDKESAEAAILSRFQYLNLENPREILWCDDLDEFRKLVTVINKQYEDLPQLQNQLRDELEDQLRSEFRHQFESQIFTQLWHQLESIAWDCFFNQLGNTFQHQPRYNIRDIILDCLWHGLEDKDKVSILNYSHGLLESIKVGVFGWVEVRKGIVVAILTPKYSLDADNRFHNEVGPAIEWPSGKKEWYLEGVEVTEKLVTSPDSITTGDILHELNAQIRSMMITRMGKDHFRELFQDKARVIHETEEGRLLHITMQGFSTPFARLEVRDTTHPEQIYWLNVHPNCKTVRQARASTAGATQEEFVVVVES